MYAGCCVLAAAFRVPNLTWVLLRLRGGEKAPFNVSVVVFDDGSTEYSRERWRTAYHADEVEPSLPLSRVLLPSPSLYFVMPISNPQSHSA
jgi:hypothetical protein